MKLADYMATCEADDGDALAQKENEAYRAAKEHVRQRLYEQVSGERLAQLVSLGGQRARLELAALVEQVAASSAWPEPLAKRRAPAIAEIVDMIVGLGPLEALLADEEVTELMVVGSSQVFYEKAGKIVAADESFDSEEQLRLVVDRIVSPLGRRVDDQQPIVNARLPQGHRVNVVIPPVSLSGTLLTIRKFRPKSYSLDELVELGSLTEPMATLLSWAVKSRKNIAVCGGTGGGKTSLLNALSQEIPHDERIVTIEDAAELRFDTHPHVARLEARMANAEGNGEISIRDLVVNALRMRPDRIIVGECRSAEALDMLQAMTTGHDGSLTTLHAGSLQEALTRLITMVRYGMDLPTDVVQAQVLSALDVLVMQDRESDGSRRVMQVAVRDKSGNNTLSDAYSPVVTWERRTKCYRWHREPDWLQTIVDEKIATAREVEQWRQQAFAA